MQIKMYNRIMNQCDSEFTKRYFLELQGLKNGGMTKENFLKRIKYSKRHYLTCLKQLKKDTKGISINKKIPGYGDWKSVEKSYLWNLKQINIILKGE